MEEPKRPASPSREELGFVRRPMVHWFDPTQLMRTAVRVMLSGIFGAYADKRELQSAFEEPPRLHQAHAADDELWIDFVADLGDGWEPTYTVAYLLGRESLRIGDADLPRGRVLVMGGDQVYPTASRADYEDRMRGPYGAALPWSTPGTSPSLFAIPGNHDWYDGLTNFLRIYCQDAWIGGWRTEQNRSYFAVELPHRWWLWAIDIQFDVYIDKPQLDYFRGVATQFQPGDRLILVTGKPSWKHGTTKPNLSYDNLRYLEEKVVIPAGGELVVSLTGDDHHYARYEEETVSEAKRQKITAGGGGAFTSATHPLEDRLQLKRMFSDETIAYGLRRRYPDRETSRRLPWWALWRLWTKNWRFLRAVFAVYLVPAILLQVPVRRALRRDESASVGELAWSAVSSKFVLYAALVVVPMLVLFAAAKSLVWRIGIGSVHAAAQLALLATLVAFSAWLITNPLGTDWATRYDLLVAVVAAALAALPGTILLALYLVLCDRFLGEERASRHTTEVFGCQALTDYKNFLRLHIGKDGALTIYPIAVDRVATSEELEFNPGTAAGDPYFEPANPIDYHLIEPPIEIPAAPARG